jgi:hypothetical protein
MKPTKADRTNASETGMNQTELASNAIDRILASEETLLPSSGFLASVMESVRVEAAAPAPIPFPWKRAIPGILAVVGVLGWGAFKLVQDGPPSLASINVAPPQLTAAAIQPVEQAGWVALALGASLLSWLLSRRLAGRSGLL